LLLCVRGTTGTVGVATDELKGGNVTRGLVPVRFNPEIVRRDFGYYLLKSDSVQGQIRAKTYGAALMQINIRDVRDLLVRVPRLQEQDRAVKVLDDLEQDSHRLECLAQQKLAALDALKASLLHHAFTGQLTNSRQHRATANA
jgi:type I restriction enzyme S subunit